MGLFPAAVYLLCFATSVVCLYLLFKAYRRAPTRLLLWSALAFVFFAISNGLLFVDLILLPATIDLSPVRQVATAMALATLLFGFIWDVD